MAFGLPKEKMIVLLNPDEPTKMALHVALDRERDCCMVLNTKVTPWDLWFVWSLAGVFVVCHTFVRNCNKGEL